MYAEFLFLQIAALTVSNMLTCSEFRRILLLEPREKILRCSKSVEFFIYEEPSKELDCAFVALNSGGEIFFSSDYFRALLKAKCEEMKIAFLCAKENEKPILIAALQICETHVPDAKDEEFRSEKHSVFDKVKQNISTYLLQKIREKTVRLLICGQTFLTGEYAFLADKNLPIERSAKILDKGLKIAAKKFDADAVLIKDFEKAQENAFKDLHYHAFAIDPNMVLQIKDERKNFESYLASMSSKYRTRANSVFKKSEKITSKQLDKSELTAFGDEIHAFYSQVRERAEVKIGKVSKFYFEEMKTNLPDNFFVRAYFFEGKIVGFASSFLSDKTFEAHFVGFDEQLNKSCALYQRILYDYVRDGMTLEVERISFGRTALEIKSTVGAEAKEMICFIRLRNKVSNQLIKPVFDYVKPTAWTPRSPFKEENNPESPDNPKRNENSKTTNLPSAL
jgi:hypothetical protein